MPEGSQRNHVSNIKNKTPHKKTILNPRVQHNCSSTRIGAVQNMSQNSLYLRIEMNSFHNISSSYFENKKSIGMNRWSYWQSHLSTL